MAAITRVSAVWKAIGRLHRTDTAIWAFKYGVPYAFSTLVTFAAAELVGSLRCGDALAVLVEWLAENAGFYGMALPCGTFRNSDSPLAQPWRPLPRILAAEGCDTIFRELLFLGARRLPVEYRPCGAALASVLADASFCFLLAHGERLLVWFGCITESLMRSLDRAVLLRAVAQVVQSLKSPDRIRPHASW